MIEFQIPKILEKGFAAIAKLSDDDFKKIVLFTEETKIGTGPKSFQDSFNVAFPDKEKIISTVIYSFGSLLLHNNKATNEELAIDLAAAYQKTNNDSNSRALSKRLLELLERGENLKCTSKALDLLFENAQVYTGSRVISDIRTIFNDELNDEKHKAVVIHNLKLEYLDNKQAKEFYISLDQTDLGKLKENIDRALEKEKQLKKGSDNTFTFITINE